MKNLPKLKALLAFDLSRIGRWLWVWWGLCLLQAGLVAGLCLGLYESQSWTAEFFWSVHAVAFLFLAVFVGSLLIPCHPGGEGSFFHARPVRTEGLLATRFVLGILALLLPLYLARLVPLFIVEPRFGPISAYSVHFWGIHLGVVSCLGAIAVASRKTSDYLGLSLLAAAIFAAVAFAFGHLAHREANWIRVASPQTAEILWHSGLALLGAVGFAFVTRSLCQGNRSWKAVVPAVAFLIALAAAWQPMRFVSDISNTTRFVSPDGIDLAKIQFKPERDSVYGLQENGKPGNYSSRLLSLPPYWDYEGDENYDEGASDFGFIQGTLEVTGLDPEVAIAARLLEARWIAPDGEIIPYNPPSGTFSITGSNHHLPPPTPTDARLDSLLGVPPRGAEKAPELQGTRTLFFGTRASIYKRFKDQPGRLEMRLRVHFWTHDIGAILPLDQSGATDRSDQLYRLSDLAIRGNELKTRVVSPRESKRWQLPFEGDWSSNWNWRLHHERSGWRSSTWRSGSGGYPVLESLLWYYQDLDFQIEERNDASDPLPEDRESLRLVEITPRYLGTTEVDVVVEDFALVQTKAIERARRNDQPDP